MTMSSTQRYDVIIIGTGAGGGTLAFKLAPSGKRILILERGDYLRREKENWSSRAVFIESRYKAHETWGTGNGKTFHPGIHYYVGGNTKVYGAALFRFREEDFGELRHHGGISPAWPFSYGDIRPYYTQAEQLYQVHGDRGADPTEPPEDTPYPFPAVSHEPRIQQLHEDLMRLGRKPFHMPVGIMLDEKNPHKSRCIRCNTCDGYPCLVNAKSDAQVICVDPALEYPNVQMLTNALVEKLETSPSGREVTRVVVKRNGAVEKYEADIVVAACGAINSAALLLRSANDQHPRGLANSSDAVGRHYMCHNNSIMLALSRHPNSTVFQKTLAVNDYYFGADDFDYPLGHIQMLGKSDLDQLRGEAPAFAPNIALDQMAKHSIDFWLTTEDLPDPENRVTLNGDGRINLHYKENNTEGHKRLVRKLKGMLHDLGCEHHLLEASVYLGKKIPIAGTAHQCGTVRFGKNPKSSVLDAFCKAHDLDNLYVVDGGFFPSSTSVNPALTIIANALRVGDHLLERLDATTEHVEVPASVTV
jgi:choline dehydrogenase-like flavoprotein